MVRAGSYLVAAGTIWLAEGFVFSRFLSFSVWQTILMACVYLGLLAIAARGLINQVRTYGRGVVSQPQWQYISLAPMLAIVVGSFASLPLLLGLFALGKVV